MNFCRDLFALNAKFVHGEGTASVKYDWMLLQKPKVISKFLKMIYTCACELFAHSKKQCGKNKKNRRQHDLKCGK